MGRGAATRFLVALVWIASGLLGRGIPVTVVSSGVVVLSIAPNAMAQDEAPADDLGDGGEVAAEGGGENLLMYFINAMGPIYSIVFLVLSFLFVSLVVMGIMQLRRSVLMPDGLSTDFEQHVAAREFQPAFELAKEDDSYLGHVLAAGMGALSSGGQAKAIEAMQDASGDEAMKIEHKISYIALVGALAPMFGLLGTVHGMVESFYAISQSAAAPKPKDLAAGIATALITTLVGLVVAIPAITAFAVFKNWLQRLSTDTEAEAERLVGQVVVATQQRGSTRPAGAPPAAPAG
jgi:biopolymer transport protein ExbB